MYLVFLAIFGSIIIVLFGLAASSGPWTLGTTFVLFVIAMHFFFKAMGHRRGIFDEEV